MMRRYMILLLSGCALFSGDVPGSELPTFELRVGRDLLEKNQAQIRISVPPTVHRFTAPEWYGGAPMFLKFVESISAEDTEGKSLSVMIEKNSVRVQSSAAFTLRYTYNIPQKISGEVDQALPVLNDRYGRFDNNLTFLLPEGLESSSGILRVKAPVGWEVATGWGRGMEFQVQKVSQLVSGMIAMGGFNFTEQLVAGTKVTFGMIGDFSQEIMKQQFSAVLAAQQEIVGPHPAKQILVVMQPTVLDSAKGTSLTNVLVVNLPKETKLEPFNFQVIGTVSHELFHQWNAHHLAPAEEKGVYLFSEGFTNYFAVAALVRAKLIPEKMFGRFLCRYQKYLERNPYYPGADFKALQDGQENADLFDLNYSKGPFVAVLLDLALRDDSNGLQSLASWFRALDKRFAGTKGYRVEDLRQMAVDLSGKEHGMAAKVFDEAFLGGEGLPLNLLQERLGIKCGIEGDCELVPLPGVDELLRAKVFSALE